MKTVLSLAFALLLSTFSLQAQTTSAVETEAKQKTEQLAKALNLDENQKQLVYRQNYELLDNAQRLKKMESSVEEKEEMTKAYMKRFDDGMKKILNEEQFTKYLEIKEERKDSARDRMKK